MVDESPGLTDDGLAEQLIVGGWNALMVNCAVQSADWPGFGPSVTWPVTVYVPGAAVVVVMLAVVEVPEIVPPLEFQV